MPLHASSYFAGVATVVGTIALGFGGGVLMTDAFVGKSDTAPTLMERRSAPLSESSTPLVAVTPNPPPVQATAAAETRAAVPQDASTAGVSPVAVPAQTAAQQPTLSQQAPALHPAITPATTAQQERPRSPNEAMARAQDAEVRKALAAEHRKAERRKWTERRKQENRKIDELNAVTEKVRQAEREREPAVRSFVAESPRIRLPGVDDDQQ